MSTEIQCKATGNQISLSNKRWTMVLALAMDMGWEPTVIKSPSGNLPYFNNDGYVIGVLECSYIAAALTEGAKYITNDIDGDDTSEIAFVYFAGYRAEVNEVADLFRGAILGVELW